MRVKRYLFVLLLVIGMLSSALSPTLEQRGAPAHATRVDFIGDAAGISEAGAK